MTMPRQDVDTSRNRDVETTTMCNIKPLLTAFIRKIIKSFACNL